MNEKGLEKLIFVQNNYKKFLMRIIISSFGKENILCKYLLKIAITCIYIFYKNKVNPTDT